ncbi:MAG: acyloxyacyl hydrolase [Flavobacteriales bacterium]
MSEHVGKLIKIHGEYPENSISSITELNFAWKTDGSCEWHKECKFPTYGFSLLHTQFGNQDVLGQSFAGIPTMRFDKWRNQTRFSIQAGFGIAWFNKPYDHLTNTKNLVIGSALANMSMVKIGFSKRLAGGWRYSLGASFTHCSNAHVAVPNIGANIVALHAGFSWGKLPENPDYRLRPSHCFGLKRIWKFGMYGITGLQEIPGAIKPVNGGHYPVYGLGTQAVYHSRIGRDFHLGINYSYYPMYREYIVSQELFADGENEFRKAQTVVFFLGYEWKYNRFALFVQTGLNLYSPFIHEMNNVWDLPKHGFLYQWTSNKLGYRFYLRKDEKSWQPYFHLAVKANGGTADYLETGVGFLLK